MPLDGTWLEKLVASIEERFLPRGLTVQPRVKRYNAAGQQIAEFDLIISGKVGTADFSWLIECRDRSSEGSAPASWIEQLVARKSRFGFNNVTAVSTTGFSPAAKEYAASSGVDLREVNSLEPGAFDWVQLHEMEFCKRTMTLERALFDFGDLPHEEALRTVELVERLEQQKMPALRSISTGELSRAENAFLGAIQQLLPETFPDAPETSSTTTISLNVIYNNDANHFVIDTEDGPVRIRGIQFTGKIVRETVQVPMIQQSEYRSVDQTLISQVAAFLPVDLGIGHFALEFHRMPSLGHIEVLLRKVDGN